MHLVDLAGGSITVVLDPLCWASPIPPTGVARGVPGYPNAVTLPLTWGNAVQVSNNFPGAYWTPEAQAWVREQQALRSASGEPLLFRPPDGMVPYPWQAELAGMFARTGGALASDDPGTGKTISAILAVMERHLRHQDALPALVVAPASVCTPWVGTLRAWVPGLEVIDYRGSGRAPGARQLRAVVTSYDILTRDAHKLRPYNWGTLVLDEHHMIKNARAKRTEAATDVARHARHAIALSGTPLTHSPDDVFPTLRILQPNTWPDHNRYIARHCEVVQQDYGLKVVGLRPDRAPEFYTCLSGSWRRVTKAEALPYLPPKIYSTRTVQMPAKWRKVYEDLATTMSADLPDGAELDVMHVLTQLSALMAVTAGPCTVEYVPDEDPERPDHVHVRLEPGSWKLEALVEILAERPDQQVLVFSPSRQLVDLAAARLHQLDIEAAQVVGGQTPRVRDEQVRLFQSGTRRVMLATTQAGGVGLTLTAASTVVFLSRPFSLVDAVQSEDRAHRIGSERHASIEIIDIVTEDSVDQRVAAVLRERHQSLADFLTGAGGWRALV